MSGETELAAAAGPLAALPERLRFHDRLAVAMTEALRCGGSMGLLIVEGDGGPASPPVWRDAGGRGHWILAGADLEGLGEALRDAPAVAGLAQLDGIGATPEDLEDLAGRALGRARGESQKLWTATAQVRRPPAPPIDFDRLQLHYQPQVALTSDPSHLRVSGVEALIRTHHPETGWVAPAVLQDWTRDEALAQDLGEWVLREGLRQALAWRTAGLPEVTLAVNLSLAQLRHPRAIWRLVEIIEASGLPPRRVELELTEQLPPDPLAVMAGRLQPLRQAGVGLALDDFGSGFASLTLLHGLPLDRVKLASPLIAACDRETAVEAGLTAFQRHAKALELAVVAEGVERQSQVDCLRRVGCDHLQGYFLGPPMAADAMARRLGEAAITLS